MAITAATAIKKLRLDLRNFRTVPQKDETSAVHALVSLDPDWFWALSKSLLEDGYHPTENIIVIKTGKNLKHLLVREGNRRIAAMKLIFGYVKVPGLLIPADVEHAIKSLSADWKKDNIKVPCAIYSPAQAQFVDKIVRLTHGKGEQAGRAKWNAVARARHNRDMEGGSEPGLDILEKYLKQGQNLNTLQSEKWGGVYPLTVLDETMQKAAPRLSFNSAPDLANKYPDLGKHLASIEQMLHDIGSETLTFTHIRDKTTDCFQTRYNLLPPPPPTAAGTATTGAASSPTQAATTPPSTKKTNALAANDPRTVKRALKRFHPKGNNREKLVTLLIEARKLNLVKFPHAFCFLLRSMFELSAKAYCKDHSTAGGPSATDSSGRDRHLVDVLRDVTNHLTKK